VFFGPIVDRPDAPPPPIPATGVPAWMDLPLGAQWDRFVADVPEGEAQVLSRQFFDKWGQLYLASDARSASRTPPSVRVPFGPVADIGAAWSGHFAYDPAKITTPLLIVRGEWDRLSSAEDAERLLASLPPELESGRLDLAKGTHLMHLEDGRKRLYTATAEWLAK